MQVTLPLLILLWRLKTHNRFAEVQIFLNKLPRTKFKHRIWSLAVHYDIFKVRTYIKPDLFLQILSHLSFETKSVIPPIFFPRIGLSEVNKSQSQLFKINEALLSIVQPSGRCERRVYGAFK